MNMLTTMKRKAYEIEARAAAAPANSATGGREPDAGAGELPVAQVEELEGKPMTTQISRKLQQLKPVELDVEDESADESKFYISIISHSFEGLSLLKRHQVVYALLAEEMKIVHSVSLSTKTPAEVGL
ncbi:unnamed protein product [Discosporangium mesarthrocarpum]